VFLCSQQRLDKLGLGTCNNRSALNSPPALGAFIAKQMAAIAAMTHNFAAAGDFYAFFQPFMGFHFSHNTTPLFTLFRIFKNLPKRLK
jgi:hypothetical protein